MLDLATLDHPAGPALAVALGVLLLLAGRRLFWLAVGGLGFLAGLLLARALFDLDPWWLELVVAAACGLVGALVAILLQRLMIGLVGFFAGGWLAIELWRMAGAEGGGWAVLFFLLGGVAAAILAMLLFELALAVLTSLVGAELIVEAAGVEPPAALVLLAVLTAAGTLVQLAFGRRRRRD